MEEQMAKEDAGGSDLMRAGLEAALTELQDHNSWKILSVGKESEWKMIEGGALHKSPIIGLLESTHDVAAKYYPMSPNPDRETKRTRKNSNEGMPTEGVFGPAKVEPNKKLTFDQ
eukprot:12416523-Karenia_brevis.AAC.1